MYMYYWVILFLYKTRNSIKGYVLDCKTKTTLNIMNLPYQVKFPLCIWEDDFLPVVLYCVCVAAQFLSHSLLHHHLILKMIKFLYYCIYSIHIKIKLQLKLLMKQKKCTTVKPLLLWALLIFNEFLRSPTDLPLVSATYKVANITGFTVYYTNYYKSFFNYIHCTGDTVSF